MAGWDPAAAFLVGLRGLPGAELLCTLLGEDALPPGVLAAGIPPLPPWTT